MRSPAPGVLWSDWLALTHLGTASIVRSPGRPERETDQYWIGKKPSEKPRVPRLMRPRKEPTRTEHEQGKNPWPRVEE